MTFNDAMALVIVIMCAAVVTADIRLIIKYSEHRWIRIPRAVAIAWLGIVFAMNLCGVWVAEDGVTLPPVFGRLAVFLLVSTILAGAIYSLRSKGTQ